MTDEANLDEQRRVETLEEIIALPPDTESVFASHLTDVKIEALSKLSRLRILFQDGNLRITDAALSVLGNMMSLEVLDLEYGDYITDQGLRYLYALDSLRWLDLGFCASITPEGMSALRSALPNCEIIDTGIGWKNRVPQDN